MICRNLTGIVLVLFLAQPVLAQEPLPEGISLPNYEASSYSTLMERTDMGNVAQTARMEYNSGVRNLSKAAKLKQKAAESSDPQESEKLAQKALKAAESADKSFREALGYNAGFIEAYAGLGEALRLQGKAEDSLQVHAAALRRAPDDMANFQGWSQSLLALNMLGNATTAYSDYAQTNPARAEVLMSAIEQWLAEKKADPGDIDPGDVERLAAWVAQQKPS